MRNKLTDYDLKAIEKIIAKSKNDKNFSCAVANIVSTNSPNAEQ